jgi:D-alanyl-D-alanine carboxypeptidase
VPVKNRPAAAGSTDPIKPIAVKTVKVKIAPIHTAALAPAAPMVPINEEAGATAPAPVVTPVAVAPVPVAAAPAPAPIAAPKAAPAQPDVRAAQPALALQAEPVRLASPPIVAAITPAPEPAAPARSIKARTGWIVQVGAFASESEAKQHIEEAQSKARKLLGRADPFTEPVTKDDKTYYRARFSGLERDQAEAACKQLRRSDIACMTVKN